MFEIDAGVVLFIIGSVGYALLHLQWTRKKQELKQKYPEEIRKIMELHGISEARALGEIVSTKSYYAYSDREAVGHVLQRSPGSRSAA